MHMFCRIICFCVIRRMTLESNIYLRITDFFFSLDSCNSPLKHSGDYSDGRFDVVPVLPVLAWE